MPLRESRRIRSDGFPVREALLAIEVVSPSSGRHDRVRKRPMYQRHVAEYWIVDLDAKFVERWLSAHERPEVLSDILEWHPAGASEPFRLDLVSYFANVFGDEND